MKRALVLFIDMYQSSPLLSHSMCKYYPTCSNYAKEAIEKYGICKGCYLSFKRILRCNPFGSNGYDPVPQKMEE